MNEFKLHDLDRKIRNSHGIEKEILRIKKKKLELNDAISRSSGNHKSQLMKDMSFLNKQLDRYKAIEKSRQKQEEKEDEQQRRFVAREDGY